MSSPPPTETPVNKTAIHKLEAAKRSLAISQRAVSTALDAAKRRRRSSKKSASKSGVTKVKRHRRKKSAGKH